MASLTTRYSFAVAFAVWFAASTAYGAGVVLITPEEAKLPPPKTAFAMPSRGVTRGPQIEFVQEHDPTKSPTHFQLKFMAHGGATIDPATVQLTYLRTPDVDLTARVKPFISNSGMDVPDAIVPPGSHTLRIDLKDSDGRTATLIFVLNVAQ